MPVAEIDGVRIAEGPQEQPCADEEHQADRDLEDDEGAAHPGRVAARSDGAAFVAQSGNRVAAQSLQRGREAEEDSASRRNGEGEREHASVHAQVDGSGMPARWSSGAPQ